VFAGWAAQTVRLYPGARAVEVEWTVGPVPVEADGVGKEVLTRYTTGVASAYDFPLPLPLSLPPSLCLSLSLSLSL
jgi:hypothetical protein